MMVVLYIFVPLLSGEMLIFLRLIRLSAQQSQRFALVLYLRLLAWFAKDTPCILQKKRLTALARLHSIYNTRSEIV